MAGKTSLQEAKVLFASGNPGESIKYFTRALAEGHDPAIVCISRGTAYMALGRHREAEDDFTMVINGDSGNERAYYFRGIARVAMGDYENAITDLTRSLTQNHNRGIAYLARGLAYAEIGEEKDAALDFNSAAAFSSAELNSFFKLFENHKSRLNKSMAMLKRASAPWKALLTEEEANTIRQWIAAGAS